MRRGHANVVFRHSSERWNPDQVSTVIPANAGIQTRSPPSFQRTLESRSVFASKHPQIGELQ